MAFVFQHCLKLTPAGIMYRLRHFGFNEFATGYIAHKDRTILIGSKPRELVLIVITAITNLGANGIRELGFVSSLGHGQLTLQLPITP
jgi:hypothetical protein